MKILHADGPMLWEYDAYPIVDHQKLRSVWTLV